MQIPYKMVLWQVKWEIRSRVIAKGRFRKTSENIVLCNNWDIVDHIIV